MRLAPIAMLVVALSPLAARAQTGLLIVAHGADPAWNDGVRAVVTQVSWTAGPVATAFLMGPQATTNGWDSAVAQLRRAHVTSIVVVPLMVSSSGGHFREIQDLASGTADTGMAAMPGMGHAPGVPAVVTGALDDAPELAVTLADNWRNLPSVDRRAPLFLIAHGPNSDSESVIWLRNLAPAAARISAEGKITVKIGLIRDDAPKAVRAAAVQAIRDTIASLGRAAHDSVTVLPVLISNGGINKVVIPADLAGLPIRYHSVPLVPNAALARWIERVALAATTPGAAPHAAVTSH